MELEFSDFMESDKSLKHELESVLKILSLTSVFLVSNIPDGRFEPFYSNGKYFCH